MNFVHAMLHSKGAYQGHIMVWDFGTVQAQPGQWDQDIYVFDPENPGQPVQQMTLSTSGGTGPNPVLQDGDAACSAHVFTQHGDALIVGGTHRYVWPNLPEGSRGTVRYVPPVGGAAGFWVSEPNMVEGRWYPSATLIPPAPGTPLAAWRALATAGHNGRGAGGLLNTYEIFTPNPLGGGLQGNWTRPPTPGPGSAGNPSAPMDGVYPHQALLSDGKVFVAGRLNNQQSSLFDPAAPVGQEWIASLQMLQPPANPDPVRIGATSVLDPTVPDRFLIFGGGQWQHTAFPTTAVLQGDPLSAAVQFATGVAMRVPRVDANAVLGPNRKIFLMGGKQNPPGCPDAQTPGNCIPQFQTVINNFQIEEYTPGVGSALMAPHDSPRTYHSTTLLCADGRIYHGAGDSRTSDMEFYSPRYITCTADWRPAVGPVGTITAGYGDSVTVEMLTDPTFVDTVVFTRPGSVTHGFDYDQRLVEAENVMVSPSPPEVSFTIPTNRNLLPPGYYMVWVNAHGGSVVAYKAFFLQVVP